MAVNRADAFLPRSQCVSDEPTDGTEDVGTPSFIPASLFVALVLLMLPPIVHLPRVPHPFREPLQFIVIAVMSVMSGTFPDTYRGFA
jgi:hypothetical protein